MMVTTRVFVMDISKGDYCKRLADRPSDLGLACRLDDRKAPVLYSILSPARLDPSFTLHNPSQSFTL